MDNGDAVVDKDLEDRYIGQIKEDRYAGVGWVFNNISLLLGFNDQPQH
ncbi:hypothetical protein [Membranihabitans marinus]|nr:hypothetical protein [Membranihabitans marinus]